MSGSVILAGARTPIGRLMGSLRSLRADDLGSIAIEAALARCGVSPDEVEHVVMGQVLLAGQGQLPARQAAAKAQIPLTVPATTINRVCLSGLSAIHLADLMISAGEASVVVAGGMESMTGAPHLLIGARDGIRFGDANLLDAITTDGLTCALEHRAMGAATDAYAKALPISRVDQDEYAAASHARASAARDAGRFAQEIVPVTIGDSRGNTTVVTEDEGIRSNTDVATLSRLRPAFSDDGTVTAGNASQISDGAAAVVVASFETAERLGVTPLAEIVGYAQVAGPDPSLLTQPSQAILRAIDRGGIALSDLEAIEINEAFAAVALASCRDLGCDPEGVNPNGGAIALGHPIGMSGTRLAVTLAYQLRQTGMTLGAAALCGGGGQGDAIVLRAVR